jgi:Protein of unknown function (DUF1236)
MRFIPLLSAVAAALLWAAPGHGQTPPNRDVPGAARTVNLTLEQRHVIRELVKELKVNPAKDEPKVAAGDNVPDKVELRPIPALIGQKVPQIKSHRFFVTQAQIVIVDPQDPKVVEVIE